MNVKEMITHIRHAIHDEQMTGFADEEILSYINDGVKFLRRTIMDIYPFFLADVNEKCDDFDDKIEDIM